MHEQLHKALDRKVWLPSGGSLIIEHTEALTVIDVNTGKNVGTSNLEETVFRNNLEAAEEIARQLRLRDIGGIIVIDFIDMEIRENRDEVDRGVPRRAGPRQDPHPGVRHLRARPGRDDPQAHRRGPARVASPTRARTARAAASSSTTPCSTERLAERRPARRRRVGRGPVGSHRYVRSDRHRRQAGQGRRGPAASTSSCSAPTRASEVTLTPVLLVDGDTVLATPDELEGATVDRPGRRRGQGPEDQRLHLQEQVNQRRRWGHRQHYATIEITSITKG